MFILFTEATRICPFPFPIWKTCTESVDLTDFDGRVVRIDKETKNILPTSALHHHLDYYIDSDQFNPDRFNSSTCAKTLRDAGVLTQFCNGPRICMGTMRRIFSLFNRSKKVIIEFILGMRWAVCLIKAVLCALVDNFEFSVQSTTNKPSPVTGMLFFSDNSVQQNFKRLE